MCFVFSSAVLQLDVGLDTLERCKAAVELCLVFYVGSKVVIYLFLVERAHAIRSSHYNRLQDWIWIVGILVVLSGFGTIATLAFISPVYQISTIDGRCRIGLPGRITLPLLVYDILINVVMTMTFFVLLRPFMRNGMPSLVPVWLKRVHRRIQAFLKMSSSTVNPMEDALAARSVLERLTWKSFHACIVILISTVANLASLFHLRGLEQGWLCLTICSLDGKARMLLAIGRVQSSIS